jgi:hypothetical protein
MDTSRRMTITMVLMVNIIPRMEPAKPKGARRRSSRKMRVPTTPEASSASHITLTTLKVNRIKKGTAA